MHIKQFTATVPTVGLFLIMESTVIFSSAANGAELSKGKPDFYASRPVFVLEDTWDNEQPRSTHKPYHGKKLGERREPSGPPYSRCYMNCINSSHPADFCKEQSSDFCD
jgi:hypothetical protein